MAKNFVESGSTGTFVAPAGGVKSGIPIALALLVVIPLDDAAEGEEFVGHTGGVWNVPCAAGLTLGAKVAVLDGALVADETAESVYCGKLFTAESDGFADLLLLQ
jgi:predicted RecA/RadA family phage recombinase